MTEKELKKLNRTELLQLLLLQTQQTEQLQKELEQTKRQLADRQLRLQNAGDLAHAVLEVNNVVGAAQEAAKQYLENIAAMEKETRRRCARMLRQAREEAARIRVAEPVDAGLSDSDKAFLKELHELLDE